MSKKVKVTVFFSLLTYSSSWPCRFAAGKKSEFFKSVGSKGLNKQKTEKRRPNKETNENCLEKRRPNKETNEKLY